MEIQMEKKIIEHNSFWDFLIYNWKIRDKDIYYMEIKTTFNGN